MHADAIKPGQRVLIVDDLLQQELLKQLLKWFERLVVSLRMCLPYWIDELKGREVIGEYDYKVLMHY